MKTMLCWTLGIVGFIIGVFGLLACSITGSTAHSLRHWSFIGWLGILLPILTPYTFSKIPCYLELSISSTKNLLMIGFYLNTLLIISAWVEHSHMVSWLDAFWCITFWSIWQIAALITYILQVRACPKS